MKKFIRRSIALIMILGIGFFCFKVFNLEKYFTSEKKVKKEEPKLQILDEDSKSRVIGVAINNNHDAWPHSGLEDSFLNYEIIAEGGITRILSFFKDKDTSRIGSVRSARHYFLDYMMENDAIFVHYGHSNQALSDEEDYGIDNINGMYYDNAFFRDESLDKDYEHTAFTTMALIKSAIEDKGFRNTSDVTLLNYSIKDNKINEREDAIIADEVYIDYSDYTFTKYVYDKDNKVYNRFMSDVPHVDSETGKQYTAKNIIVYKVQNYTIDSADRQNLENIGEGEGYYISNGYAVPISWSKADRSSKTIYTYADGTEIKVNDGNTWIQIQPKGKLLDILELEEPSTTEE